MLPSLLDSREDEYCNRSGRKNLRLVNIMQHKNLYSYYNSKSTWIYCILVSFTCLSHLPPFALVSASVYGPLGLVYQRISLSYCWEEIIKTKNDDLVKYKSEIGIQVMLTSSPLTFSKLTRYKGFYWDWFKTLLTELVFTTHSNPLQRYNWHVRFSILR